MVELTKERVGELKVAQLKTELSKRGLPTSGLKKDLVKRLESFLDGKESNVDSTDSNETETREEDPDTLNQQEDRNVGIEDDNQIHNSERLHVAFEESCENEMISSPSVELPAAEQAVQKMQAAELVQNIQIPTNENMQIDTPPFDIPSQRKILATLFERDATLGTGFYFCLILLDLQYISDRCLSISRLLPPFEIPELRGLLENFGNIEDLYLNFAKSTCFVRFLTEEEAKYALKMLQNQRWPPKHGELLFVTSIPLDEALESIDIESRIMGPSFQKGFNRGQKRSFSEVEATAGTE